MKKVFMILLSIPKILFFNFRYLPISQAYKLPVIISYNTNVSVDGRIRLKSDVTFGMIVIGFHRVLECNVNDRTVIRIEKEGVMDFCGLAHIGRGSKLFVAKDSHLSLGDNFSISASSAISCYHHIEFGKDIQFSWNCLVMDSDTHVILDKQGIEINKPKPIVFGDKIWIGCNSTILKGSRIPSNCVIGANSVVTHNVPSFSFPIGSPAKLIKALKYDVVNYDIQIDN